MGAVASCVASGPGVIPAGGEWPRVGEPDRERRWWGARSGLVGLYLERGP